MYAYACVRLQVITNYGVINTSVWYINIRCRQIELYPVEIYSEIDR